MDNPKKIIGFIKFVDEQYIDSYKNIRSLHFSPATYFTKKENDNTKSLIPDSNDGRILDINAENYFGINCFTKITKDMFVNNKLNENFVTQNLESEGLYKRNFIIITTSKMEELLSNLKEANKKILNTLGLNLDNSPATFINRCVKYIPKYHQCAENMERKLKESIKTDFNSFEILPLDENTPDIKEIANFDIFYKALKFCYFTKDIKYSIQNEMRIGIILPFGKYKINNTNIDININTNINTPLKNSTIYIPGYPNKEIKMPNIEVDNFFLSKKPANYLKTISINDFE